MVTKLIDLCVTDELCDHTAWSNNTTFPKTDVIMASGNSGIYLNQRAH